MTSTEDKLRRFQAAIQKEVERRKREVLAGVDQVKSEQLSKAEDTVLKGAYEMIQHEVNELSVENRREISQQRLEKKKEYLERRKALEDALFDRVKTRLVQYAKTERYKASVIQSVEDLVREYPYDNTVFQLNRNDQDIEAQVLLTYGRPCKVEYTDSIEVGGVIYINRSQGYIIDRSLDAVLQEQREWFHVHGGFDGVNG